jgi:hypothetical protein
MNKVLNITNRLEDKKRKLQAETHRGKMETLQRIVQCSSCHFKCAMCGYHLTTGDSPHAPPSSPSNFYLCESCRAEFKEYMEMKSGKKESAAFWHNRQLVKLWSAWFDFQQAIKEFKDSVEFEQLIEELDN